MVPNDRVGNGIDLEHRHCGPLNAHVGNHLNLELDLGLEDVHREDVDVELELVVLNYDGQQPLLRTGLKTSLETNLLRCPKTCHTSGPKTLCHISCPKTLCHISCPKTQPLNSP